MRLKVLNENTTMIDQYYLAEPGLSFLLEEGDTRLIFDTGYSGIFLSNAEAMGEDLSSPSAIVLSHGHDDHTAGLRHWLDRFGSDRSAPPSLIAHPLALRPKRDGDQPIGLPLDPADLGRRLRLRLSAEVLDLGDRFVFLGQIPRTNPVEARQALGEIQLPPDGKPEQNPGPTASESGWTPDYLLDDSALVWKGDEGLVIITGCSHSGIVNIVEYAIKVCKDNHIQDIVGGFHLLAASTERLDFTRSRLSALAPRSVHPCHCTDLAARIHLASALPVEELGVGKELHYT